MNNRGTDLYFKNVEEVSMICTVNVSIIVVWLCKNWSFSALKTTDNPHFKYRISGREQGFQERNTSPFKGPPCFKFT